MALKVADVMWEMLAEAGVKRCYGIVGDALNPVIDALRRNGKIEYIHVRHEEYGVFAAVADAYLSGNAVVVCGTAGPGVTHLFNGLMDARKEGAAIIAIAGDVETKLMDTAALEELNPYKFFDTACLYAGRVVNPEQVRAAYEAIHHADLLLLLGTDFPFPEFLPGDAVKKVQIDRNPKHIGRRTGVDLGLVGDIKPTVGALLAKVRDKTDSRFLDEHVSETDSFHELLQHYVEKGPGMKPIRPEFLAATLSELASDDALFFADTGTACILLARHVKGGTYRRIFGSFSWASMANAAPNAFGAQLAYPGRQTIALCGDGGFTMLALGDLMTQVQRKTPVVQIILNNESLDFVNIEMQEAGVVPFGVDFKNPNFARVAEAMGAKGIRIEEPDDVREGLAEALAYTGGPVVVDAVVDPYALSLPSHIPFHAAEGFTLSLAKQVLNGRMDSVIKTIERNVRLV